MGQPLGVGQKENEAGNDNDAAPDTRSELPQADLGNHTPVVGAP